jgi:hypothetical protein
MSNVIKRLQTNVRMSQARIANRGVDTLLSAAGVKIALAASARNES